MVGFSETAASCDCAYNVHYATPSGGCRIVTPPPEGYKCYCTYSVS